MQYLRVKNWDEFQHYKDRNPPWIKLHVEILSSHDWTMLADASKLYMVICMVIASKNGGRVPNDPDYIKRVAYLDRRPNINPLIESGFLIPEFDETGECKQMLADARPETETEESRAETENTLAHPVGARANGESLQDRFEKFWDAYPAKRGKGAARKSWGRIKPDADLTETIVAAVNHQREFNARWQDPKFIPYPATWLNQERWLDE